MWPREQRAQYPFHVSVAPSKRLVLLNRTHERKSGLKSVFQVSTFNTCYTLHVQNNVELFYNRTYQSVQSVNCAYPLCVFQCFHYIFCLVKFFIFYFYVSHFHLKYFNRSREILMQVPNVLLLVSLTFKCIIKFFLLSHLRLSLDMTFCIQCLEVSLPVTVNFQLQHFVSTPTKLK